MITDIKHLFSMSPFFPENKKYEEINNSRIEKINWVEFSEGVFQTAIYGNKTSKGYRLA
jgi:hypothetical protein